MEQVRVLLESTSDPWNISSCDLTHAVGPFKISRKFPLIIMPNGEKRVLMHDLEVDRAREEMFDDVKIFRLSIHSEWLKAQELPSSSARHSLWAELVHLNVDHIFVPAESFGVGTADFLREQGIKVEVAKEPFLPERAIKTEREIEIIEKAQRINEQGMKLFIKALQDADVGDDNKLYLDGELFTSERAKEEILNPFFESSGYTVVHPEFTSIVACGLQSAVPHNMGSGPLYANKPIIVDIFPRCNKTRCWADITRSFVKKHGNSDNLDKIIEMWKLVCQAQSLAKDMIVPGANGREIYQFILNFFTDHGYPTGENNDGKMQGFFHALGHGVGIGLHEWPFLRDADCELEEGQVLTAEPGLYIPDIGGIREEDIVVVTEHGCRSLNTLPHHLFVEDYNPD